MHRQNLEFFFFSTKQIILRVGGQNIKINLKIKFLFFPSVRKITVGGFVNQLIKKIWPNSVKLLIFDNLQPCVIHVNYYIIELHLLKT